MVILRNDKWLFICSMNYARSPTAEYLARKRGMFARSCGTAGRPRMENGLVVAPITTEILQWADVVVCMKESQRQFLLATYLESLRDKPVYSWDFDDDWGTPYHEEMIALMEPLLLKSLQDYDEWREGKGAHRLTDC